MSWRRRTLTSRVPAWSASHAAFFNAFPSLVWIADAQGGCSFVNQAWEDYTGWQLESEVGARWLESIHEEDRSSVMRVWAEALGLRRGFESEYRLRRADGLYGWIHHSAVPVNDESGRLAGFLGTCHDITERRDAELDARAKERTIRLLRQVNASISRRRGRMPPYHEIIRGKRISWPDTLEARHCDQSWNKVLPVGNLCVIYGNCHEIGL